MVEPRRESYCWNSSVEKLLTQMSDFTFEARIGKKIAEALREKAVDYSLVADHSSIKNEIPSRYPGNFGNDVLVTIGVRDQDDDLLRAIHEEVAPVQHEQEVEATLSSTESGLIRMIRGLKAFLRI